MILIAAFKPNVEKKKANQIIRSKLILLFARLTLNSFNSFLFFFDIHKNVLVADLTFRF